MPHHKPPTLVIISQVYAPDPAAVGQHLHEAAVALTKRGVHVRVLTSARGYDNPDERYPANETLDGVTVQRLPLPNAGKGSIASRLVGGTVFLAQAAAAALRSPHIDHLLISTSPPHTGPIGALVSLLRRVPTTFWVMDINPDQVVTQGQLSEDALPVRLLEWGIAATLRRAFAVVTLDRFMAERLSRKADISHKLTVMPPWPLEQHAAPVPHADNPFVRAHGLAGKLVVMYSGNISLTHPIDSVLEAAAQLTDRPDIAFVFIGGGQGKQRIEEFAALHPAAHILILPYQSLTEVRYSLSAAHIHVVTMGDDQVGIVHPCKVYGAMAMARAILYVGPEESHVSDIINRSAAGYAFRHGQSGAIADRLRALADGPREYLTELGEQAQSMAEAEFSRKTLITRFCEVIEQGLQRPGHGKAGLDSARA